MNTSKRIAHVLDVLAQTKTFFENPPFEGFPVKDCVRRSIDLVASRKGIKASTVESAMCRNMGLSFDTWVSMIEYWLKTGDYTAIKQVLLKNASQRSYAADCAAIRKVFP